MGKKITNTLLFLIVVGAAVALTVYVGQGAADVMLYNFIFLGIMILIYLAGLIGGMFKMDNLAAALRRATEELGGIFKTSGKVATEKLPYLNDIFDHRYLNTKMGNFTDSMTKSEEGIGDIEEYLNEEELDLHIHKRLLEMVPDILTSLGILGTFVGLVWGLKNFQPNNYEAMTSSVSSLVEGIKVAFLTSIYGISLSIVYTFGMKSNYSSMTEQLQAFLEKFHSCVIPTAENESRNLLVASQRRQTEAMGRMAEQFSSQMADSFEKVITPTFVKMNDSLDLLATSVTRCQQDAIKEILHVFLEEMHSSFQMQFADFNSSLEQLTAAQKENTDYTTTLYQTMSRELSEAFVKQERAMKDLVADLGTSQSRYLNTANRILEQNQEIQKQQQADYQHVVDYLKDAERSSAKFWVACNQTMQKYVETAAQSLEGVSETSRAGGDMFRASRQLMEKLEGRLQEYTNYQKRAYETMDQIRGLLSDISAVQAGHDVQLVNGRNAQNANMDRINEMLESQGERQQELLQEMSRNIRDLSKAAQKGKFGLFR